MFQNILIRVIKIHLDHFTTSGMLIDNLGTDAGISAMSISEMTQIPRATIIRKCKYLIKRRFSQN